MILLRVALDESAEKRVSKDGEKSTGQTDAGVIERIIGTPHLYRINESDGASQQQQAIEQESVSRITSTICIIAIPHQTPFEELLDICGDPWSMVRRAIQIIDPQSPNIYTAVLDCLNEEAAETMFLLTNGRQMQFYDSSEVFVGLKAIYLDEWSESNPDSEDTSQQSHPTAETGVIEGKAHDLGDIYKSGSSKKKEGAAHPGVELPTCPICLDRMDAQAIGVGAPAVASMVSRDGETLQAWPGNNCQACQITLSKPSQELHCQQCGKESDLWVCLICGNLGCARYSGEHAKSHFSATNHSYSLDLTTQRIWDYIGDRFVHRICQTEDGRTMVEFDPFNAEPWSSLEDFTIDGKMPKGLNDDQTRGVKLSIMTREYNILLQSELEEQRRYYEDLLAQAISETEELKYGPEILNAEDRIEANRLKSEISNLHANHNQLLKDLRTIHETNRDYRKRNQGLLIQQKSYKEQVQQFQSKTQELQKSTEFRQTELEQQVQDLKFYLKTQLSVRTSPQRQELQDGIVLMQERQQENSAYRKRHRRKKSNQKR
mmetsp:Transcript_30065/g.38808  ORF Transcript_30065/g.38808 Transcript_30065/m.38808 type:complete len:546 (+) Transcript_30065:69-1706(+)